MTQTDDSVLRLWTSAQPGAAAFVSGMIPDYHAAEDVLQECAVILPRKFSTYDSSKSFLSWVIGICRLEVLSRRRRYLIEHLVSDDDALENIARAFDMRWAMKLGTASRHCFGARRKFRAVRGNRSSSDIAVAA